MPIRLGNQRLKLSGLLWILRPAAHLNDLIIHILNRCLLNFISRAVYDGAEPEKFMDRLDVRIKGHDKEIERMCNYHYQGFIESIRSLLTCRGQVESIKVIYMSSANVGTLHEYFHCGKKINLMFPVHCLYLKVHA